jgi:hypothetical protein
VTAIDVPAWLDRFDPTSGVVIRTPPGRGYGYWVGGHKIDYDPIGEVFALFYRERTPLEHGRGGVCAVALSGDGVHFDDVWRATKEEFASTSIEVGHAVRHDADEWRLYVSYELAGTSSWRIDVIRAREPAAFSAQERRTVLNPADFALRWIKDPFVRRRSDGGYLLYAAAPARGAPTGPGAPAEPAAVVRAAPRDAAVLAESDDGLYFPAIEYVLEPPGDDSWQGRRCRLNSVLAWENGYLAWYDAGRTTYDDYEEWCGLATSPDGRTFQRVSVDGPWTRSPHGCVRYLDAVVVGDTAYLYYEYTREDHAHDLRVVALSVE